MNRKATFAEKLKKFVEGKGFYVAVLVCVATIGISGFYLLRSVAGPQEPDTPVSATASVAVTPAPANTPSPSPSARPRPSASPAPSSAPPTLTAQPSPTPSPSASAPASPAPIPTRPTALVYTWPVRGEVLADFSLETLAYDETMGDWRTHSGIDIACPLGQKIVAAAEGTVSRVFADDLMGTTVVIDHGNGITSTYANLQTVPTVTEGDKVYTGSVIGAVGSTAIAESGRPTHLHFEMTEDGIAVDPELYLPEQP